MTACGRSRTCPHYLGIPVPTLYRWRRYRCGPPCHSDRPASAVPARGSHRLAQGPAMIERRGNSWRARYRGPDRRERSKTFRRKSDAERWLTQQRSLMAQGDWTDPALGRITFGEYAEAWLESRADLKPKTRHQYQFADAPAHHADLAHRAAGQDHLRGPDTLGLPAVARRAGAVGHPAVRLRHVRRAGSRRAKRAVSGPTLLGAWACPGPKRRDYVFLTHRQVLDAGRQGWAAGGC